MLGCTDRPRRAPPRVALRPLAGPIPAREKKVRTDPRRKKQIRLQSIKSRTSPGLHLPNRPVAKQGSKLKSVISARGTEIATPAAAHSIRPNRTYPQSLPPALAPCTPTACQKTHPRHLTPPRSAWARTAFPPAWGMPLWPPAPEYTAGGRLRPAVPSHLPSFMHRSLRARRWLRSAQYSGRISGATRIGTAGMRLRHAPPLYLVRCAH